MVLPIRYVDIVQLKAPSLASPLIYYTYIIVETVTFVLNEVLEKLEKSILSATAEYRVNTGSFPLGIPG
jgi:hypothetical protein